MMNSGPLRIDWRDAHRLAEPYLAGRGGVIAVAGYPTSACNTYAKLLMHSLQERDPRNVALLLSPGDAACRSEDDLIVTLEEALGMEAFLPGGGSVSAVTGITAHGGSVNINDVNISGEPTAYEVSLAGNQRAKRIVEKGLNLTLRSNRVVLVLYNWHEMPRRTRDWFWSKLMGGGRLERLTGKGLLIVCAYTTDSGRPPHDGGAPTPELSILLRPSYDGQEREHARQDVAGILARAEGLEMEEALVTAGVLLREWSYEPQTAHVRLPWYLLNQF
ncbi:MAG: hypothetical protein JOZ96_28825 [Acidobacteria bacterium]|nr:hypothetical protein [Acidobacteriota bacterium]MBV9929051.1 hypothetical protein [Acidobacteriota bacterium]